MSISEFFRLFATHSQLFLIYKLILNYIYKRCLRIKSSSFERISTLEDNLASLWSVILCIDFID